MAVSSDGNTEVSVACSSIVAVKSEQRKTRGQVGFEGPRPLAGQKQGYMSVFQGRRAVESGGYEDTSQCLEGDSVWLGLPCGEGSWSLHRVGFRGP